MCNLLKNRFRPMFFLTATALAFGLILAPLAQASSAKERYDLWVGALQTVLETRKDLSLEESSVLFDAIRNVDARAFESNADPVARQTLFQHADALTNTLSCKSYGAALTGFGELGAWLQQEDVLLAASTCNCSGNASCGPGYSCKAVTCTSEPGTTNWGRCGKDRTSIIADPVDPIVITP